MAKSSLCGLLALLCAASLLSSIGAEELSAAEAIVEARNDDAAPELPQPQADIDLAEPLPVNPKLSEVPILPVEVNDKPDENVGKTEESAPEQEPTEDSKKENLELAINAEVLKQPGMSRLARQLESFHNYQVYRAQKYAGKQRAAEFYDDENDELEAEERAIRRRKRVRRRNVNNNVRRTHNKRNVANRQNSAHRHNQRRKSVRRQDEQGNDEYRPANSSNKRRRGGSSQSTKKTRSKSPKRTNAGKKRRTSSQKGSSQTKRRTSQRKRTNRNSYRGRNYVNGEQRDVNSYRFKGAKVPQMLVIVDNKAPEASS
ncbi:peptidyl-prolyl cis-trans isomerase G-like [Rhagoletis pomonella]|uniref:peptidyl-prolyl cis-trans isomerase G-like n=1 Tax=Rhagoletis pomonella TaxID=28610 RepID=UPI00177F4458|nr:peptidyl-prolyl cis-trans isomerase G-like [Rhagoletis pomonella]